VSSPPSRIYISEKGESIVTLTLAEAMELQEMRFCTVSPTPQSGRWRISDVARVGTAIVGGKALHIVPKTPLENIVHMASLGRRHISLRADAVAYGSETAFPAALARAFLLEVQRVTRRGLVKGYEQVHESASVMRGRWDVSRQLAIRPGMPLPLEVEYDHFSEDVPANRVLHTAIRALRALDLPSSVDTIRSQLETDFLEVGTVPRGMPLPPFTLTRLTDHLSTALVLARAILDAVSWTHREGARRGGTFLVNIATIFEAFVAERLRAILTPRGHAVTTQDRRWWLDSDRSVALRPDIVVSREEPLCVADTKYKVLADGTGAPPTGDVYQMVAYGLALQVPTAHLIYVSGDVISRSISVPAAGVDIEMHAVDLSGDVNALEAEMLRLADSITRPPRRAAVAERRSSLPIT